MKKIIVCSIVYLCYLIFCYWLVILAFNLSFYYGLIMFMVAFLFAKLVVTEIMRYLWK